MSILRAAWWHSALAVTGLNPEHDTRPPAAMLGLFHTAARLPKRAERRLARDGDLATPRQSEDRRTASIRRMMS